MFAILPLLCFGALLLLLHKLRTLEDWRERFLLASVGWGLFVAFSTELLSLFHAITFGTMLAVWGAALLLLLLAWGRGGDNRVRFGSSLATYTRFELLLLVGVAAIVCVIGAIAWVAPPNNWDSMTYHMSRVMHWQQNGSVAHYPTHIARQLYQCPWSEFAILHFQILAGNDRCANLVQWFSLLSSLIGVSLLAKHLGATQRGQVFAVVACGTIPMGILQGSSTQNDYVASYWLVCFTYFALLLRKRASFLLAAATGAALGLALLTKATAYFYALPFLVWLCLSLLKARSLRRVMLVGLVLIIACAINLGYYARNYRLYQNPFGPGREGAYVFRNEAFTCSTIASNFIRNIGLHVTTPSDRVNQVLGDAIALVHRFLAISPSDPRITWAGTEFHVSRWSRQEDYAGNPFHLFLIVVAVAIYLSLRDRPREAGYYLISLLTGFLLFCAYLKWQPWHSRLHLPLFVLWAPFIGLIASRGVSRLAVNITSLLLVLLALPWVLSNSTRPVLGKQSVFTTNRIEQMFISGRVNYKNYLEATRILSDRQYSTIGLMTDGEGMEYPLWVLLSQNSEKPVVLKHVNVTNVSAQAGDQQVTQTFSPGAIFVIGPQAQLPPVVGAVRYEPVWSSNSVSVYQRLAQ